jgi:hypothetical protein
VSFPYDLHRATVFNSHMPCRARAVPLPRRFESDFSRPRHSAAGERHGMGELTSALSTACGRPAYVRLLPADRRSLTKDDDVGSRLAVRIFPATTRTFTKETAGQGHSTACVN